MKSLMLVFTLLAALPAFAQEETPSQESTSSFALAEAQPSQEAPAIDEAKAPVAQADLKATAKEPTTEETEVPVTDSKEIAIASPAPDQAPAAQPQLPTVLPEKKTPEQKPAEAQKTSPAAEPADLQVSSKSASEGEREKLEYLFSAIQEDLKGMSTNSKEVVQTTSTIGRMMMKMRQIDAHEQQRPISDTNLVVNPKGDSLEKLKSKFEDFKDEHWSRFTIPNFEYRFFKRDRDLVTVQNHVTLKKIIEGITTARSKFMPIGCFDFKNKAYNNAPVCQKRLAVCGQNGFGSQDKQLVAFAVSQDYKLEPRPLDTPDDAEEVLGTRYDTTSDRATLLSDETFYFCKLAARFGATFKAEPMVYPAEVAAAH